MRLVWNRSRDCRSDGQRVGLVDFRGGDILERAAAEQEIQTAEGMRTIRLWVSTEKMGRAVLLRIDGLEPG